MGKFTYGDFFMQTGTLKKCEGNNVIDFVEGEATLVVGFKGTPYVKPQN